MRLRTLAAAAVLLAAGCGPTSAPHGDPGATTAAGVPLPGGVPGPEKQIPPGQRGVVFFIEATRGGVPYENVPVSYTVVVTSGLNNPVAGFDPDTGQPIGGARLVDDEATPTFYRAIIEGAGPATVTLAARIDISGQFASLLSPDTQLSCRAVASDNATVVDRQSNPAPAFAWLPWVVCFANVL